MSISTNTAEKKNLVESVKVGGNITTRAAAVKYTSLAQLNDFYVNVQARSAVTEHNKRSPRVTPGTTVYKQL